MISGKDALGLTMESEKKCISLCSRSTGEEIIPEVYFSDSESQQVSTGQRHSTAGGSGGPDYGSSVWTVDTDFQAGEELEDDAATVGKDLGEGFIPIDDLEEKHLPKEIRCWEALHFIKKTAERVVYIDNRKMSESRPETFKIGKRGVQGTGFILWANDEYAIVSTNRHVLYNNEEIRNATLYLNYNKPKQYGNITVVGKRKGLGVFRGNQTEDFTLAMFALRNKCIHIDDEMPTLIMQTAAKDGIPDETTVPKIVCVISHPLRQPKQVSFGRVLKECQDTGEYEHDAPTHPGSSGAPLLIFSRASPEVPPGSIWYHIAKMTERPGVKMARLQVNDSELFDMNVEFVGKADLLSASQKMPRVVAEKIISHIDSIRLMSSWTCFGGIVLQPERFLSKLEEHPLTTCKELMLFSDGMRYNEEKDVVAILSESPKLMVEDFFQVLTQKPKRSSENKITDNEDDDHKSFYQAVLTSSDLCTCKALLRLVTAEDHSENKVTDTSYLCPDSFPLCSWQHNTWPFGLQDHRQATSPAMGRGCVRWNIFLKTTKKSLQEIASNIVWHEDTVNVKKVLHTLMIGRVAENLLSRMKKSFPNQTDMVTQGRIKTTTQHHVLTHSSIDESLNERRHECLELILNSLEELLKELDVDGAILVVMCSNYLNSEASDQAQPAQDSQREAERGVQSKPDILLDSDDEVIYERVPHSHISKKEAEKAAWREALSKALHNRHQAACEELRTLVNHVLQHCRQDHKDGADHQGERCECGRPSLKGLMKAVRHIKSLHGTNTRKDPTTAERTYIVGTEDNEANTAYRKELAGKESKAGSRNCSDNGDAGIKKTEKICPSCGDPSDVPNGRERCKCLACRAKTNTIHKSSTSGSRDSRGKTDARSEHDPYNEYMDMRARKTRRHTRTQSDPDDEYIYVRDRNAVKDPAFTESSRDDEYVSMLAMKELEDHVCVEPDTERNTPFDECNKVSVSHMTEVSAMLGPDNCYRRKLLSQSKFCFLFHGQFSEAESQNEEEEEEVACRLQGLILLLRRFVMTTEVFLYNCQQFLSSFHHVLGCPCDVVRSAARASPPDNVHGDDAVPAQAGTASQERGQAQDPDILSMEAMEDFVFTQGTLPAPVDTVGSSESCLLESDTKLNDRMYTSVEEAQMALVKVLEKSLDKFLMNGVTEQYTMISFAVMSTPLVALQLLLKCFLDEVFGIETKHLDHLQIDSRQEVQCNDENDEDDANPASESFWEMISYRLAKKVYKLVLDSGESCVDGRDARVTLPLLQRATESLCMFQFIDIPEFNPAFLEFVVTGINCTEMLAATSTSGVQTSVFSDLSPNLRRQLVQEMIENEDKIRTGSLPFFNFVMMELAVAESLADSATEHCLEKATVSCLKPAPADFQHTHTTSLTALKQAALLCNSTSQAAERGESSDEDDEAATEPDEEHVYVRAGNKGGNHTHAKSDPENEHTHVCARSFMTDHTRTELDENPATHVHDEPQQLIAKRNCSSAHKNGAGVNAAEWDLCRPSTNVPRNQQLDQDDIVPDSGQINCCSCTLLSYFSSCLLCWCRRSC